MKRFAATYTLLLCLGAGAMHARPPLEYSRVFAKGQCSPEAYSLALRGYNILREEGLVAQPRYLTVIDFAKPSHRPRLFVIDMQRSRLALQSTVAHGSGSDPDSITIPCRFSNREGSLATSLGFYLTGKTYTNHRPQDSLGLCLFGLDSGYNDAAATREIVVHYGATEGRGNVYVTDTGAGRSSGCPALPLSTNSRIINLIKEGGVLFIYSPKDPQYARRSAVLSRRLRLPIIHQGPPPNNCACSIRQGMKK